MTRKKSNVKALALAVTCAILAGGGIGLEPVYAADVTYNTDSYKLQNNGTDIGTLTVGNVTIHGIKENEKPYGITIGDSPDQYVNISNHDVWATGAVHASIIASGLNARIENGKVVAQNGLYIGYTSEKVTEATYENSKFAVNGENGSFKAANGKFTVSGGGAITADSLTLAGSYDVKQNIENAKGRITTVEGDLNTNKAALTALQGRVDGHDTDINALKTTTQGITRVEGNGTTVEGVNFKDGAVSDVKSINGRIKISTDGKTVTFNEGVGKGQVIISENGIKVGTGSTYVSGDAVYTGGADYDSAKAGMKNDGSLKATGFSVDGATGNTTVGGDLTVNGAATFAKETAFAGGIKTDTISEKTDGAGVTVDGVLLKDKGITAADGAFTVEGATGNVTTTGDIKGKDITATGALSGASLDVTGNATVCGTLGVTGDATFSGNIKGQSLNIGTNGNEFTVDTDGAVKAAGGKVEIDKTGKATFGDDANNTTTIAGKVATFGESGSITDHTTINGGNLDTYNLTVRNDMTVEKFRAKNITSEERITVGDTANGVYLNANGTLSLGTETNQNLGKTQLANINDTIKANRVIEANSATIDGVEIKGGNVITATGTVQGKTIYDGVGAKLENGKITAKEGQIGNVTISAAGEVTGVSSIKANTFKVDEDNYLNSNGIKAKGGEIGGAKIDATTLSIGGTKLDNAEGITTNKLKIDGMTLTDTKLDTGAATFEVNGVKFNQGQVTAHADKGFVAGNSYFKQGSLIVDANNKLETTNGLTTEKATVKGDLDVTGNATFGTTGKQTTIKGDAITTDTLRANKLILGASGDTTVEVEKDGSLIAAKGKFKVDKDGALKAANGAFNVDKDGETNFKKDDNNLSSINGGNIWAKATDVDNHTSSVLQHDSKGLHVKGNRAGETSAFDFDAATGISTFTGQDSTTTTINGSAITSTKADGNTGVLDGSNLTLTNGDKSTKLTAGGVTFTGTQGSSTKHGNETKIDGGIITTDTLKVQRIELGENLVDKNGEDFGSNLSMDKDGNFSAANGNFKVIGGSGDDKGAFTNKVGNTTLQTNTAGASMKFNNTAADGGGGVTSEVAVEANKATVAAGDKASFIANTDNGGTATITGGTQTVTTTDKGTVFENTAHNTPFVENGATTTIINGNEITTGKVTTDQLVITGQGDADGKGGSIAFGGNGTIKSDINDGQPNGKNTSFETKLEGVNTKVTDGTITTENKVSAAGNSNTVKQDDTHKSEFNQGLTSIGGVVTNGEVKIAQTLDGEKGNITNEVTDKDGKSSKLVQSGTGLEYTDSTNADNATRINSSDVSIGSATDDSKRINLSDLGQIDDLDTELKARDEYKNNPTAVGGINAEAAIRREEVTRLDNRIDDVNTRVDKVGAMAAAIASLKSIGYDPQAPSEFSIGLGQYKGETGVAMGFFHYPNKNFMINVSLSTAGGETMGGIGATWRFGHKSPQKLLEEQREAQAKKELAAAEKYQAAAKLAKEAQKRAEYAAKLARQAQVSADNAKAAADATQAKHFG